jgi:hypothetical protein
MPKGVRRQAFSSNSATLAQPLYKLRHSIASQGLHGHQPWRQRGHLKLRRALSLQVSPEGLEKVNELPVFEFWEELRRV